jgi:fatty-acyl-CoA synthase
MQQYALTVEKFLDHAAKWHGRTEVVCAGGNGIVDRIAYARLGERCRRLAGGLRTFGPAPGERIATLAWNSADHLTVLYAVMGAGRVCHTLNPRLSTTHLVEMVNEAQDRWLVVGAGLQSLAEQLLQRCRSIEHVVLLDGEVAEASTGTAATWSTLAQLEHRCGDAAGWARLEEEWPAGLCYTSGTVGSPRGVLYTHRSNYLHTLRALQADAIALTAADSVLVAVPMFHANGWGFPFAAPAVGAKMGLPGRSTAPAHLRHLLREENVTVAAAVQTVWLGLVDLLEREGGELPSLKRILIGGSHCPQSLLARLEQRLGARVQTSWGMTELSPLGTIEAPDVAPRTAGRASGRPVMGLDLKLVDAEGRTLPEQRGVVGHLRVKGASVAEQYFNDEAPALDEEGYFDTGDLGFIDTEGNLAITGRAKDLIKSGGEWINPREIEDIVSALPGVGLVAVVGRPDAKWGERPVLVVEPRAEQALRSEAILESLRGRIPSWWMPDCVVLVEKMPLAATGKIDKKRLRERVAEG